MTDFEAYEEHYKNWTRARHENCWNRISEVIIQRTDFALGRGAAYDDWEYAQRKNEVLARWSPFTYCVNQCFHSIST